jgi:hypothetical protein
VDLDHRRRLVKDIAPDLAHAPADGAEPVQSRLRPGELLRGGTSLECEQHAALAQKRKAPRGQAVE